MTSILSLCGIIVILLYGLIAYTRGERYMSRAMSFTRHPKPLAAPLNDEVNFECSINIVAEFFAWAHRPIGNKFWNSPTNYSNGETDIKTSRHIVNFNDVSKAGDYRCVAFFGPSGLSSDMARLTLATIQEFSDKSEVFMRVIENNTAAITCPVPYSEPEAVVEFYKDDMPIRNTNLVNRKTLVIENAKSTDSGSYHCTAYNYITQQTVKTNYKTVLMVQTNKTHQTPYFNKQLQTEYVVLYGKNVTLECVAAGYPEPHVNWTRLDGSPLSVRSSVSIVGLTITNVQPSDRGEYDCEWRNKFGQVKSVIILKVVEPPKVLAQSEDTSVKEGGEVELLCNVTGEPEPTVEWLVNGESLLPSKNVKMEGSSLKISVVEKKHAGFIQCVASNAYGSHSGYSMLLVNPKERLIGNKTTEIGPYGVLSGRKNTKGGGSRKNKGRNKGGNKGGKKKGNKKGNKKGVKDKSKSVKKNSQSDNNKIAILVPPTKPNVTRLSDIAVMVRWSVPENKGLPIQFFKVQYKELGQKANGKQGKWMTANSEIPNHVRSFEVPDLQPNHTYKFRIAAVYSNNDNALSACRRFHLNEDIKKKSHKMPIPLLINTETLGPNQVLLIWQNPNSINNKTEIEGFYIYHRASTSAGDYLKTTVEGKDANNMTISHLQADTTYEFKIQSFSVDAASEFSQILRQKTKKIFVEENLKQQAVTENKRLNENNKNVISIYFIIGVVFGILILLVGFAFAARFMYKRAKHEQSQQQQSEGKPITNGRVMNGGVTTDSKINITSNPLAGLDTSEDIIQPKSGQQSSMEMTSFLNGQNNNGSNNGDAAGSDVNVTSRNEPSSLLQGPLPIEQRL